MSEHVRNHPDRFRFIASQIAVGSNQPASRKQVRRRILAELGREARTLDRQPRRTT